MKLVTYKRFDTCKIYEALNEILVHHNADSFGNVTIIADMYKDGKKVEEPENNTFIIQKSKWARW